MPNAPAWMKEKAEDLNNAAEYLANSSERSDSYNLIRFIRSIPNPHAWVNSTAENLNNAADLIDNPSAGSNSDPNLANPSEGSDSNNLEDPAPPSSARSNVWAQIRSIARSLPSPSAF